MDFSAQGSIKYRRNNPTFRGLNLTEQTKFPLQDWPCAQTTHWISDLSGLWQRTEPVDRWWSSSPPTANYFCPGPRVPVEKPSMLSVTLPSSYHFSFPLSLCPLHPSLSPLCLCLQERRNTALLTFGLIHLPPFIFLRLRALLSPSPPLIQQLWSKLISRWFSEMLIDWTV